MTQDQYGQAGESGYGVRDDAAPGDDVDDGQSKPMTAFQKVASALRGDRPDRDKDTTDETVTGETAPQGDMPTNPDVPPTGTGWGTQSSGATAATAVPDSRDALDAQDPAGRPVPTGTVAGSEASGGIISGGTTVGDPAGTGAAQRDYWDEPADSAASADPAATGRVPGANAAPGQSALDDQPAAPTFTPADGTTDAATADYGTPTARNSAGSPETAVSPMESPLEAGSPAAEGTARAAGPAPAAGAAATGASAGVPVADAPMADAPVTGAPVAGAPAGTAAAGTAAADTGPADTAAGATAGRVSADTGAAGTGAGDLRPGEAAGNLGDFSDLTFGSLIPDAAVYTDQWQQVQFRFVDDPHGSVTEAAEIVSQVTAKLESAIQERQRAIAERQQAIAAQQKSIGDRWGEGSNADTETLRETLRMYKTFLDQLVGPKAER